MGIEVELRAARRARCLGAVAVIGAVCCAPKAPPPQPATPSASAQAAGWLDRPLANWNVAGQGVISAPRVDEPDDEVVRRCKLSFSGSTAAEKAVAAAGWIPFLPGGQQVNRDGVEIVGGMNGADGMCRPVGYNLFVFVSSQFAGTLSPTLMTSRLDSSSGMITLTSEGVTAEFVRYRDTDPLCCPSSRVAVRYRIDRTRRPLVVPLAISPIPAD
jgi:hypothetical protein